MSNQLSTAFSAALNAGQSASTIATQTAAVNATPAVQRFYGTAQTAPKAQVQARPRGFVNPGLNLMVVDTSMVTAGKINPGADFWLLLAQAVHSGTPFLGKYNFPQGDALLAVDTDRWATTLSMLPGREIKTSNPYLTAPLRLGMASPATLMGDLVARHAKLKMLAIDNLRDFLPGWGRNVRVTSFKHEVCALHDACGHLSVLAILDKGVALQKKLWADLQDIDVKDLFPVIKVNGAMDGTVPVASVSANGSPLNLKMVDNKWVEVGAHVRINSNQSRVLAALKNRPNGATVKVLADDSDMFKREVYSALQALMGKGDVERIAPKTYRAKDTA